MQRLAVLLIQDQACELATAGHVGAFADHGEVAVTGDLEGLQATEPRAIPGDDRHLAWSRVLHGFGDGANVIRRGPATAAQHVDQTALGKLADQARGLRRGLVVFAKRIGQPRVGVATDEHACDTAQLGDVRTHVLCTQRAVDAHAERIAVHHAVPEGGHGLTGQRATAAIGDGHADHHGQPEPAPFEYIFDGEQRSLGVERIENGLDEQDVHAAFDQRVDLLFVRVANLIVGHGAKRRVVDIRRQTQRAIHRADRSRDEARLVGCLSRPFVGNATGQARRLDVQLRHDAFQRVVGLGNAGRGEGVRLDDVCPRFQVLGVNALDDVRSRQHQQIVIALEILGVVFESLTAKVCFGRLVALHHRPHRAVQNQDALRCERLELGFYVACLHRRLVSDCHSRGGVVVRSNPQKVARGKGRATA